MKLKELAEAEVPKLWAMTIGTWIEIREATEEPTPVKSTIKGSTQVKDWICDFDAGGYPVNARLIDVKRPWKIPIITWEGGKVLGTIRARDFLLITGRTLPTNAVCQIDIPEIREAILRCVKMG